MSKPSILVLDDMFPILDVFQKGFSKDYDVVISSSLSQAKLLVSVIQFDFIFTDINLGSDGALGGFDFVNYLIDQNFLGKIVIMSGYMQHIPDKIKHSIDFVLHKPFTISDALLILKGDYHEKKH